MNVQKLETGYSEGIQMFVRQKKGSLHVNLLIQHDTEVQLELMGSSGTLKKTLCLTKVPLGRL